MTEQLARPLTAVSAADRPAVGGKAAALGELTAAGIPVPPGFAVTTGAFARVLRAADPDGSLVRRVELLAADDHDAIAAATASLRGRILRAPLPAGVHEAIAASYRALGGHAETGSAGDATPVAVRSSATGEDSAAASYAGLQDTYLWVQGGDEVAAHVRRCWASLYSVESVAYRRHQGLPEEGLAMGVVVQAMVDPRCAGVMFTRSPVTGDTSVVVLEASWGLGSALVSGDVTPDSYVVSKVTGEVVRRTVAAKLRRHQRDAAGPGVRVQDVPPELQQAPCLRDEEIRELATLGRQVAEHYGAAQDIEWAIEDRAGGPARIHLLQSRPETVWSARGARPAAVPAPRPFDHVLARLSGQPGGGPR
ncbi:MAG: PEP/pyruvate-binding domain-containing protein [Gemmatimonadota bacterium]